MEGKVPPLKVVAYPKMWSEMERMITLIEPRYRIFFHRLCQKSLCCPASYLIIKYNQDYESLYTSLKSQCNNAIMLSEILPFVKS